MLIDTPLSCLECVLSINLGPREHVVAVLCDALAACRIVDSNARKNPRAVIRPLCRLRLGQAGAADSLLTDSRPGRCV